MSARYILVEGVNIYANVLDTNQISVIRGGSFLLKDAIIAIEDECKDCLDSLSLGASSGLFRMKSSADNPDGLMDKIKGILEREPYATQTFTIESCKAENLLVAKEQLLGQLRVRQLNSATLAPDLFTPDCKGVSDWHGVRPKGTDKDCVSYRPPGEKPTTVYISRSEKLRWKYGRYKEREVGQSYHLEEVKRLCVGELCEIRDQESYKALKKDLGKWSYCRELGHIADSKRCEPARPDYPRPLYPKLDGKIAVFYADGNSFTKIQRRYIDQEGEGAQKDFDLTIRGKRAQLLADLLGEMLKEDGRFPHIKTRSLNNVQEGEQSQWVKALRLETLLWGGDELMFVMPAWIGFEFVQMFFEKTADWEIGGQQLSHSAGLVFCSAKTPIRIVRELARMIADDIKERTDKKGGKRNAWDYMVLESIDYPTHRDYPRFLQERYGSITVHRPICLPEKGNVWAQASRGLKKALQDNLPIRQLYRLVQAITRKMPEELFRSNDMEVPKSWPVQKPETLLEKLEERMLNLCDDRDKLITACKRFAELFGLDINDDRERAWLWLHLLELREYIAPRREKEEG